MAAKTKLELRDLEILRALLRVRYLTTRQINDAFFSCPRVGRRRIHRISEYDLIRPHSKGLPEVLKYKAWRLTARGLDAIASAMPDEPIPDGTIDRVATGSLHHALHREALADLYLRVIVAGRGDLVEHDLAGHRRWVAAIRAAADSISWQPDGDVVLSVSSLGERTDVVPDAVVCSTRQKRRIFIELDRSTKDLGRIRQGLLRYKRIFAADTFGGDTASVLFVVRSSARKDNIQALGVHFPMVVLLEGEAVEWLRKELLAVPAAASRSVEEAANIEAVARRAYGWMSKLDGVLRANGMRDTLHQSEPALMKDGHERLIALYRVLKALEGKGAGA